MNFFLYHLVYFCDACLEAQFLLKRIESPIRKLNVVPSGYNTICRFPFQARENEYESLRNESLSLKPDVTVDPFSEDSSDTIEYSAAEKLDEAEQPTEAKQGDDQGEKSDDKPSEGDTETKGANEGGTDAKGLNESGTETKAVKDETEKQKGTDLLSEIIDLCSDVELDDLLPDINDADNKWKI